MDPLSRPLQPARRCCRDALRFFPGAASSGGCCRRRCSRSRPNACYACWPTLALAQPSEWVDRRFAARRLVYRLHGPHRSRGSVSPADSALGVFSRAAGGCALRTESSWLKFRPTDFQHTIRKFRVTVLFGFSDKSVGSGKRSRRPFALGLMRSSSVYEVPTGVSTHAVRSIAAALLQNLGCGRFAGGDAAFCLFFGQQRQPPLESAALWAPLAQASGFHDRASDRKPGARCARVCIRNKDANLSGEPLQ